MRKYVLSTASVCEGIALQVVALIKIHVLDGVA